MDALFTAFAALVGSMLGVFGSHITQRWTYGKHTTDRLREQQRQTSLRWLTCVQHMYQQIADLHRALHRNDLDPESARTEIRAISSLEAQIALEDLRLVASDALAIRAADLWRHMRREGVPIGQELDRGRFQSWSEDYWKQRRNFVNEVRQALGQRPLDWEAAGITEARPDDEPIAP